MNNNTFNMVETVSAIHATGKKLFLFTFIITAVAAITVFLMPRHYRSTAKIISANPQLADKSRLFNDNIQGLYSYFGSGDDLDRIIGIADLDTTYKQLVDEYKMVNYYELSNESLPMLRRKAVLKLREDLSFQRTEQGQLKISCWTKDKQLSADIVNTMTELVRKKLEAIWHDSYQSTKQQMNQAIESGEREYKGLYDSLKQVSDADFKTYSLLQMRIKSLVTQLEKNREVANQFSVMGETQLPAFLEAAVPASKAERPDKPAIILAAAIAGFIFSVLLLLLGNRKQMN